MQGRQQSQVGGQELGCGWELASLSLSCGGFQKQEVGATGVFEECC